MRRRQRSGRNRQRGGLAGNKDLEGMGRQVGVWRKAHSGEAVPGRLVILVGMVVRVCWIRDKDEERACGWQVGLQGTLASEPSVVVVGWKKVRFPSLPQV